MYTHKTVCSLLRALCRGQKDFWKLPYFKSPRADNHDVFQTLNVHCSLKLQITKKSQKSSKYQPLLNRHSFIPKEAKNQRLLTLPWHTSNYSSFKAHLPKRSLSVGNKGHASSNSSLLALSSSLAPFFRTILHLPSRKVLNEAAP